jgi:hypothetical protein
MDRGLAGGVLRSAVNGSLLAFYSICCASVSDGDSSVFGSRELWKGFLKLRIEEVLNS